MEHRSSSPYSGNAAASSPFGSRRNTVGGSRFPQQQQHFDTDPAFDQMRHQFDRDRDMFFDHPGMRQHWSGGGGGAGVGHDDDDDFFMVRLRI